VKAMQGRTAGSEGRKRAWKAALAGVGFLIVSVILLTFTSFHVYFGFAGTFCLLLEQACSPALP